MTNIQKLERARKRVEQGWTQGVLFRGTRFCGETPKFCAVGAVICNNPHESDGEPERSQKNYRLINKVAEFLPVRAKAEIGKVGDGWRAIVQWNNAPGRRKAHIVAFFDRAIAGMSRKKIEK